MPRSLLLAAVSLLWATSSVQADFADYEALDKFCLMLKKKDLKPFPMCNERTSKGSIFMNNSRIYWNEWTKVYLPGGEYVEKTETSQGEIVEIHKVKAGWKLGGTIEPAEGYVFVNVGPSKIEFEGEQLRKGEYVMYDGTKLVRGSLRPPDRVRIEPRDTNREKADDLASEAFFCLGIGNKARARELFNLIIRDYSDTTSAERAKSALARIAGAGNRDTVAANSDPELSPLALVPDSVFVKEDGQSDADAADHLLSMAKMCKALNQFDKSSIILRGLIDRYPETRCARKAAFLLESIREQLAIAKR